MSLFGRLFGKKITDTSESLSNFPQRIDQPIQAPIDWSNSEINFILLSRFLEPKRADSVPMFWESALGEPPQVAVKRFIENRLLLPASLHATIECCNTVADLKKMLKERDLKISGKKQELVERLVVADELGMSKLHATKQVIECSPEIRPRVLQYVTDKEREFDDAVAETLTALRTNDFAKASRTIGAYEANQLNLSPPNPLAIPEPPRETAADVETLQEIFAMRPKILSELAENEWEPLHVAVALSHLLHGRLSLEWLPAGFAGISKFDAATTVRMMQFHIIYQRNLKKMRALGITQGSILCGAPNAGSCDACMKIADKIGNLDDLPELPYEKCTCHLGCRCTLRPVVKFDDDDISAQR
jgi:SAP domain